MTPISEDELGRVASNIESAPIAEDRPCESCGYNLRGLTFGVRCPECGTPVVKRRADREPPLGASPRGYLTRLRAGLLLLGFSGLASVAFLVFEVLFDLSPGGPFPIVACDVAWFVGALLVLERRPLRSARTFKGAWTGLRIAILATQAFALVGAAMVLLDFFFGGVVFATIWLVCAVVSIGGWVPMCEYLARLAEWAPDDGIAAHYRAVAWAIGVPGAALVVGVIGSEIHPIFLSIVLVGILFAALCALACVYFCVLHVRLAGVVVWGIRNAAEEVRREGRRVERLRAREAERVEAEARQLEAFRAPPDPVDLRAPGPAPTPGVGDPFEPDGDGPTKRPFGQVIERPADAAPLELEDDGPEPGAPR